MSCDGHKVLCTMRSVGCENTNVCKLYVKVHKFQNGRYITQPKLTGNTIFSVV